MLWRRNPSPKNHRSQLLLEADLAREAIHSFFLKNELAGLSAIIESPSGSIEIAHGSADITAQTPMTVSTPHRLASVSKQFTAVAVLSLIEEGDLKLENSLEDFFPGLHPNWKDIKIENLLNHTSGLADYLDLIEDMGREYDFDELHERLGELVLRFYPGERFEYSNTGYLLLGHIVQSATQFELGDYIESLAGSLGMNSTKPNDPTALPPNLATGYNSEFDNGKRQLSLASPDSRSLSITGDGGLISSCPDLVKWNSALYRYEITTQELLAKMVTPVPTSIEIKHGVKWGYGFGIGITERDGRTTYSHAGEWNGTSTYLSYNLDTQTTIAILVNCVEVELSPLVKTLENLDSTAAR